MAEVVVIADDEPDIVGLVELWLSEEGFETHAAATGEEALRLVAEVRPDVLLLDVMLPDMDGFEVCKRLRADHRTAPLPVVMLTARAMTADRIAGLTAGADDYVTKPVEPEELVARVRTTLRRARELRGTSPLTGLPGNFEIQRLLDRLLTEGAPFALLHVDLCRFKSYNDRYGFLRGDRAIATTADLLDEVIGAVPGEPRFLGHVGGDDFALVVHPDAAVKLAECIVERFDAAVPLLYDPDDRERGYVETVDRRGGAHRHPFVSIAVGVASTAHRGFATSMEAAAVATEMKELAKAAGCSAWRIDRRRG